MFYGGKMMNNLLVLPMVIPLLTGIMLVFFRRFLPVQRWVSLLALIANGIISIVILNRIQAQGIFHLNFGGWEPPYGILFVADSFAMLLVLTTNLVAVVCILYAMFSIGKAREKTFFYPFVHFLIAGVNGSFLTGDLFNLLDRKSTRLNSSHVAISYAVFCLKKKNKES